MGEKIYTESEISAMLGEAARMQALLGASGQKGLTLEEIKAAAAEAGIDPSFVEIASSSVSDQKKTYLGVPTGIGRTMFVQGSLTDERWNQMVNIFMREFGGPGTIETQGSRRSWAFDSYRFTAEETGGQIVLHAESDWGDELELPIALSLVGGIATLVSTGIALVSLEWTIGIVAALMMLLVVGSFSTFKSRRRLKQEQHLASLETLLNQCAVILQEDGEKSLNSGEFERDIKRIELPETDYESASQNSRQNNRIR